MNIVVLNLKNKMKLKVIAYDGDNQLITSLSSEVSLADREKMEEFIEKFRVYALEERPNCCNQCDRCEEWFIDTYEVNSRTLCHDCDIAENAPLNTPHNE